MARASGATARSRRQSSRSRGPSRRPRRGLTFSPSIVVARAPVDRVLAFGAYLGGPAPAVRQATDHRGQRPGDGRGPGRRGHRLLRPRARPPRRHHLDRHAGPRSVHGHRRRGRRVGDDRRTAPRPEPVRGLTPSTRIRASAPSPGPALYHRAVPEVEAPTLAVDQPAEGATYENGAIPVQGRTTNATTVVVSAAYSGPPRPAAAVGTAEPGASPAHGLPRAARPHRRRSPSPSRGRHVHATPFELTAGRWAITVTASNAEGKTRVADPERDRRLPGRQRRRDRQGRPGLAQGLGRWQGQRRDRRRRQGLRPRQGPDLHRQGSDRGPHRQRRARPTSRSTGSTSGSSPTRATRGTWLFAPPAAGPTDNADRPGMAPASDGPADRPVEASVDSAVGARVDAPRREAALATPPRAPGGVSRARPDRRDRGVLHRRPRRPRASRTIAGSSGYFLGGVVSYCDAVKAGPGVPRRTLEHHGAVAPRSRWRWRAASRDRLGATLGVGVTGVAGPDGGTAEKPVGLVYVAVADAAGRRRPALPVDRRPDRQHRRERRPRPWRPCWSGPRPREVAAVTRPPRRSAAASRRPDRRGPIAPGTPDPRHRRRRCRVGRARPSMPRRRARS